MKYQRQVSITIIVYSKHLPKNSVIIFFLSSCDSKPVWHTWCLWNGMSIQYLTEVSTPLTFFFFVINNFFFFFFHTQHNIISKIQQNKTTDTYSTSQGPIKREGEREGQQEHKSHSFIQSRMSNKKHCQASMVEGLAPPTRAVVHSHDTIRRRLRIQYVFLHVWCKPVLDYCLLHSCKTSKQHSLLH